MRAPVQNPTGNGLGGACDLSTARGPLRISMVDAFFNDITRGLMCRHPQNPRPSGSEGFWVEGLGFKGLGFRV